jgi:hypothetical protein
LPGLYTYGFTYTLFEIGKTAVIFGAVSNDGSIVDAQSDSRRPATHRPSRRFAPLAALKQVIILKIKTFAQNGSISHVGE